MAIARSRGLRLLVACQHLDQLSDGLRTALLANTAVQAFFRLGYADAKLVAASLSAGTGERVSRVAADVGKRDADGFPEAWASATHTVRDGRGEPVALSPAASQAFWHLSRKADGAAQVAGLQRLSRVSGIFRLYVHAADTKLPTELSRYVRGLSPDDYRLAGTDNQGVGPIRLVVAFPRPRLSVLSRETEAERGQRWVKALTGLPVQRAVLRLATGLAGTVQVADVADPGTAAGFNVQGFERFLSAAVAGSGQSAKEVEQAQAWRRAEAERVAGASEEQPETQGTGPRNCLRDGNGISGRPSPKAGSRSRPPRLLETSVTERKGPCENRSPNMRPTDRSSPDKRSAVPSAGTEYGLAVVPRPEIAEDGSLD